jgi:hypothetical protein
VTGVPDDALRKLAIQVPPPLPDVSGVFVSKDDTVDIGLKGTTYNSNSGFTSSEITICFFKGYYYALQNTSLKRSPTLYGTFEAVATLPVSCNILVANGDVLLASNDATTNFYKSTDGQTFSANIPIPSTLQSSLSFVGVLNGSFFAIKKASASPYAVYIYYSADGSSWTQGAQIISATGISSVSLRYAGGVFDGVAYCYVSDINATTTTQREQVIMFSTFDSVNVIIATSNTSYKYGKSVAKLGNYIMFANKTNNTSSTGACIDIENSAILSFPSNYNDPFVLGDKAYCIQSGATNYSNANIEQLMPIPTVVSESGSIATPRSTALVLNTYVEDDTAYIFYSAKTVAYSVVEIDRKILTDNIGGRAIPQSVVIGDVYVPPSTDVFIDLGVTPKAFTLNGLTTFVFGSLGAFTTKDTSVFIYIDVNGLTFSNTGTAARSYSWAAFS